MREFEPWSAQSVVMNALAVDAEIKHRAIQQNGAKAQIASEKILANQNALLEYLAKHAHQQEIAMQERDKIESERYRLNTGLSRVAAWSGVISAILSAIAIWIQLKS